MGPPERTREAYVNALEKRSAGVLLPLFSIRTDRGWGIGEYPDIGEIAPWLARGRFSVLMMLPLLEAALGQDSPYSALSAFALDPIYIAVDQVEDYRGIGGSDSLDEAERRLLEQVRANPRVDYGAIRRLKEASLRRAFEHFQLSGAMDSERGRDFARFREEQADWLADYALFRALKAEDPYSWWRRWEPEVQFRDPSGLSEVRARLGSKVTYFEYLQWLAARQLSEARREARRHGVQLAGDLPFMVAEDSADAWSRQDIFGLEATVGVPPDAYSADGQDWGLPIYLWDKLAARGYDWLVRRGEQTAQAFDIVRVDHVVGFYRTYVRPRDKSAPYFSPAEEPDQLRQGEAVMEALRRGGAAVIAEDLGTVPPFVRVSLTQLGIPGFRVLRWEQDETGFNDPRAWPALSVATTGTHDTETLAVWWEELPSKERAAILALPTLEGLHGFDAHHFGPLAHRALLHTVYGSGSNLLVLPIQDVFGLRDRINLPGTMIAENWTWRMPWTIEQLWRDRAALSRCAALGEASGRAPVAPWYEQAPAP